MPLEAGGDVIVMSSNSKNLNICYVRLILVHGCSNHLYGIDCMQNTTSYAAFESYHEF